MQTVFFCIQVFQLLLVALAASDRGLPLWFSGSEVCGAICHPLGGIQHSI